MEEELREVEDFIDFGDRDDEFLSKDLKQQAVSIAIISGVIGFIFSALLFLGKGVGPASVILDRKAAEGRVVTRKVASAQGDSRFSSSTFSPQIGSKESGPTRRIRPVWKDLEKQPLAPKVSKKSPEDKKRVAQTSIGGIPEYTTKKRVSQAKKPRPQKAVFEPPAQDISRLLFPRVDNRPETRSPAVIAQALEKNLIVLESQNGERFVGLVLNPQGQTLVSNLAATPRFLNRVRVNGERRQARKVAEDAEYGLALIDVGAGDFQTVPLSPSPPSAGERLTSFVALSAGVENQASRAGLTFSQAGYFLDGSIGRQTVGTPLLNKRGELAGFHMYTYPESPGTGLHLAADSAAIYRLLRGYQNLDSTISDQVDSASGRLSILLQELEDVGEAKRGRVLSGTGIGVLHLGMPLDEVKRKVSSPKVKSYPGNVQRWDTPAPPLSLYFVNDRLAVIGTVYNGFSTPDGLSVGAEASLKSLSEEYEGLEFGQGFVWTRGLEIFLDASGRVEKFVIEPDLSVSP